MAVNLPTPDQPHEQPAVIPAIAAVMGPGRPNAPLPQYNPSVLVLEVVELLGRKGISVVVDIHNAATAVTAASDLLRAIGCAPSSSPWRSR